MMTNATIFPDLFRYELAMDARFLELLEVDSRVDDRTQVLVSHLLQTPRVWHARVHAQHPSYGLATLEIFPQWSWLQCWEALSWLEHELMPWVEVLDGDAISRVCTYRTTGGREFTNSVAEILHHLLLHGAYHRGQIAQAMRRWGADPPATDYIIHRRRSP